MILDKKNIILCLGFLALCWIAYQFSFSKTFAAKNQYEEFKTNEELLKNVSNNLLNIKKQNEEYSELLEKYELSSEGTFQNNLLKTINLFSKKNQLAVLSFKDPYLIELEGAIQETYEIEVRGDYTRIIALIYHVEHKMRFGKVSSVHFEKKKNYRSKRTNLNCKIYLQRIVQI